jgi:transcriptional regulator with XRE-family HTH domain
VAGVTENGQTLAARVGQLLQDERARRLMSQAALAERAGTTQQRVSLIERGTAQPTTALLDRLFAVLNLQVRVEPEPLGAGQDGEIDKFARLTEDERVKWFRHYDRRFDQLGDLPYVLGGRLAAFLQGVPIGADRLDLVVAESDLDRFADWFERVYCHRWNERWGEYGGLSVDPREPGLPLRWMVGYDEVRLEIMPALPASVTVCCGERRLPVRPLVDLEREHSDIRRLMRRVRDRAAAPGPG